MTTQTQHPNAKQHLDPNKPKTLKGILVIDFTRILAGPTCMENTLKTKKAQEWHQIFNKAGIPASLVLNVDDTRKLDHIKVRGMVRKIHDRLILGTPLKFGTYNSLSSDIPPPELNADNDKIRKEFEE